MSTIDYKDKILPIIKEAGKIISRNFNHRRECQEKSYANYVTDLDKRVETFVIQEIRKLYPDARFVSEEDFPNMHSTTFWALDPIDGTTNLLHGYRSVSIALAHVIDGVTIFGAVYCPTSKELFYAERGCGAYLETTRKTQRIYVNSNPSLAHSLVGFGCPYDKSKIDYLLDILKPILNECDDLKRQGPASLDICYVACGRLSAYLELDLEVWDYLAGGLILVEAGGTLTDFSNNCPDNCKSNILATNGKIHNELLNKVRKGIPL